MSTSTFFFLLHRAPNVLYYHHFSIAPETKMLPREAENLNKKLNGKRFIDAIDRIHEDIHRHEETIRSSSTVDFKMSKDNMFLNTEFKDRYGDTILSVRTSLDFPETFNFN